MLREMFAARLNQRPVTYLLFFIIVCSCFHSWYHYLSFTKLSFTLFFFPEQVLLLCLPLTTLASLSFAKIQYWHLRLPTVCVCARMCVCLNCSEDIQFECFSSNALSGWGTVVFLSMGLMDWRIQHPCPYSLAHTCKHRHKLDSDFVALVRWQKGYFLSIIVYISNTKKNWTIVLSC